ncbi:MAG TPA: amino acid racemase [Castellaniella sp.]|uniref:aspartate/glutamate racemase family protein n=1 Tax=Castellaniella sp. TaxID=1955812 RepID=UPI002F205A78
MTQFQPHDSSRPRLGVLGGMGPLAGASFAVRIVQLTAASKDQDHIPVILVNDPDIPDRSTAHFGQGDSPLPAMIRGLHTLESTGVDCIAIPCNTAHLWFEELHQASSKPILHIVDAVIHDLQRQQTLQGTIGLLGTPATLKTRLYQNRLESAGYKPIIPTQTEIQELLVPAIAAVKANRVDKAYAPMMHAIDLLRERGAESIVLGCTELPLAIPYSQRSKVGIPLSDSIDALAREAIRWINQQEALTQAVH